jgi:hypothetical protein
MWVPIGIVFKPAIFVAAFMSAELAQCLIAVPALPIMNLDVANFILPREFCFQKVMAFFTDSLAKLSISPSLVQWLYPLDFPSRNLADP